MGISKAQLSRHVSKLETMLGIQLLYRTTRSLSLTESGEQFFLSCSEIEERYEEAIDHLKQDFQSLKGTIRLTAPISFGSELLPLIIHEFTQKYPNIKIVLSLTSSTEDLIEKNFDLALRVAPSLPDSTLRMRTIMLLELILCAAPAYFTGKAYPQKIEDLKEHQYITSINRSLGLSRVHWDFYQNQKVIKFTPDSKIEADSLRAQIHLISLGAGIGRVPSIFIRKELEEGTLIKVLPTIKQPQLYAYLLYSNRKSVPKKLQIFIDFIKNYNLDQIEL